MSQTFEKMVECQLLDSCDASRFKLKVTNECKIHGGSYPNFSVVLPVDLYVCKENLIYFYPNETTSDTFKSHYIIAKRKVIMNHLFIWICLGYYST